MTKIQMYDICIQQYLENVKKVVLSLLIAFDAL